MNKKIVSIMLTVVMVSGAFVGCGSGAQETEEPTQAVAEVKEDATQEEETVTPIPTEEVQEEEVFMYTLAKIPLRAENNKESEKLDTLPINTEVKLLKEGKTWCKVEVNDLEGYVTRKHLTEDKKEADAAAKQAKEEKERIKAEKEAAEKEAAEKAAQEEAEKKAQEEAKAAEEEAQARAEEEARALEEAQAQAEAQAAQESMIIEEVPEERYEVSRENFDDCDGSGHGYTEIHYSDGSVETVEY